MPMINALNGTYPRCVGKDGVPGLTGGGHFTKRRNRLCVLFVKTGDERRISR